MGGIKERNERSRNERKKGKKTKPKQRETKSKGKGNGKRMEWNGKRTGSVIKATARRWRKRVD